jgi:uncharacterized membrane protein YbhN (UPF0104 family)
LALVAVIFKTLGLADLGRAFVSIPVGHVMEAVLGALVVVAGHSLRFHVLLRRVAPEVGFGRSLAATVAGLGVGLVTPGRMGEAVRILPFPGRRAEALGALLVERLSLLLTLLGVAALCAAWYDHIMAVAATGALAALTLLVIFRGRLSARLAKRTRPGGKAALLMESLNEFRTGDIMISIALAVGCMAVQAWQLHILINRPDSLGFFKVLTLFPLSVLTSLIPVTVGGLGIREGTLIALLASDSVPSEAIAAASLVFYLVYAVPTLAVAALVLTRRTARAEGEREAPK